MKESNSTMNNLKRYRKALLYFLPFIFLLSTSLFAAGKHKTFRVAYFEGGPYFIHKLMIAELKNSFDQLNKDSIDLVYEPYGYFSAGWNRDSSRIMARQLAQLDSIDIVIAAGPWVIQDLVAAGFKKPIVGIYQYDPQISGLLDSSLKPIVPNLTVNYQPNKLYTDIATMEKLFPSRNIGVLYFPSGDESAEFRNKVYKIAGDFGAVVYLQDEYSPKGLYSFFLSLSAIHRNIDVLYTTPLWGMDFDQMEQLYRDATHDGIPVFSSEGFQQVGRGATASDCISPYKYLAKFSAYKLLQIANGARPDTLPVIFDVIEELCLNIEGANKLGRVFKRNYINNAKTVDALRGDSVPLYTYPHAIEQAVRENSGLLLQGNLYDKAMLEIKKAYSAYYPSLGAGVGLASSDNNEEAALFNRALNRRFYVDVVLNQRLFSYPAIKAIQIAKKKREIDKINMNQAELDLKHTVTIAYLSVLEYADRLAAHRRVVEKLRDYWENAVTDYRLGLKDSLDVALIEERLVAAKIDMFDTRNGLRVAKIILNVLLNRPGDDQLELDMQEFSPGTMVNLARHFEDYMSDDLRQQKLEQFLVKTGIENSYDMQRQETSIRIKQDYISIAKKRYLPELSLRAKYSYSDEFGSDPGDYEDAWTIGGILSIPIFSNDKKLYDAKILSRELDGLQYSKDSIRFAGWQDIITKADYFATRTSTLPMNYFVKNLAVNILDSAYAKYNRGEYSCVEFLSLEKNASEREEALITDRYRFFEAYTDLMHTIGVGYLPHKSTSSESFFERLDGYMNN
jgi:outer membrane protein TolC/ABC-type uncharacterized transport system substrate-binding protein